MIFSIRDIAAQEEICFNYMGMYSGDEDGDDDGDGDDEYKEDRKEVAENEEKEGRKDPVYVPCECGAANCKGEVFLYWKPDEF